MRKNIRLNNNGQSSVEFVLVFMLLMLIMLGLVDFSRAWWVLNSLNFGAREGTRSAIVTPYLNIDDSRIINRVEKTLSNMVNPKELSVKVRFDSLSNPSAGDPITVSVSHVFDLYIGKLIPGLPEAVDLRAQSVMRYEVY